MPKVSVIVPVYNVEKYLPTCLDSLVQQTLKEIEIIVVNDGSTDNSLSIMQQYAKKYPDKIKIYSKENGGLSDARNYGIDYATGDYIAFLDSDDYVDRSMYETLYQKAVQTKADMVECDFYWVYPQEKRVDSRKKYRNEKDMIMRARVVAWNKLYNRHFFNHTNLRFTKGVRYEDVDFFYRMIPYLQKIEYVKQPFIFYIQRDNSISNQQSEKNADIFKVLENILQDYRQRGIYETYHLELEYMYVRFLLCSSFLRMVKIKDKTIREKLLQQTIDLICEKFPNWKKNAHFYWPISAKNLYMLTVNRTTFTWYSKLLGR